MSTWDESKVNRDGGRFANKDTDRDDAGQVVDPDAVTTETSNDGGRTIERTHADGSSSTEVKGLWGRGVDRKWPDGRKTRYITKKRYVTDGDDDVTDILVTETNEEWSPSGHYTHYSTSDNWDGSRSYHSVESGPMARSEEWDNGYGQSRLDIVRDGDHVTATYTSGETSVMSRPAAGLGDDPLTTMSKRVRAMS